MVAQVAKYRKLLKENVNAVQDSYLRVCDNLRNLDGLRARHPKRHEILERIKRGGLSIDVCPRLAVFGFDRDQKQGSNWRERRKKLWDALGKDKVLLKGRSNDFRRGISS